MWTEASWLVVSRSTTCVAISSSGTSLSGSSLWLNLQGAVNVRDVGGLPVTGGGRTRCGVLIRSDLLHDLTPSDVTTLVHGIGIRQVIDLRAPSERHGQPVPPLVGAGVAHVELIWAKLAAIGSYAEFAAQAPSATRGADAATMEIFLDRLQERSGGAAAWFLSAGTSPRDLAAWRQRILVL